MRMYRLIWSTAMTVLVVVGLAAALIFLPVTVSALIVICGTAFDAVMRLSVADLAGLEVRKVMHDAVPLAVRDAVVLAAVVGYAAAIGAATVSLLVLAAVSAPAVAGCLPAWFGTAD